MRPTTESDCTGSRSPSEHGVDGTLPEAIVIEVAAVTGRSPLEMRPLYEVIDPDALNRLFDRQNDQATSMTVSFDYCGHRVTVTPGRIEVTQLDAAEE